MPIGWQLILRCVDDAVLAPTVQARRAFSACVTRLALGLPLVAFHAPDGHAHLALLGDRALAGQLARALAIGLGRILDHAGHLEPVRLRPVHDQSHARNLFRYTLDQRRHHGLALDPFHEASALPDLLDLRVSGRWMRAVVAQHLPRVRRDLLVQLLGVEPRELQGAELRHLADAAAAAIALPELRGRASQVVAARAAAVQLARAAFRSPAVAEALDLALRTVQRLGRVDDLPPELVAAVDGQWRLRSWVGQR